jgi:hypothetical protein
MIADWVMSQAIPYYELCRFRQRVRAGERLAFTGKGGRILNRRQFAAPKLMSPEDFAACGRREKERWGGIIRRANMRLE